MGIKHAIDWHQIEPEIRYNIYLAGDPADLHKLYNNVNGMVSNLSKLEVDARRTHSEKYLVGEIEKINDAIERIKKLTVMAILMKSY